MSNYINNLKRKKKALKKKAAKMYDWILANTSHPDFSKKYKEYNELRVKIETVTSRIESFGSKAFMTEIYSPNKI